MAALYSIWTGDVVANLRQAERLAWQLEDHIATSQMPSGSKLGSEFDLVARFDRGVGVVREALAILELRGECRTKKGPGGGIFVTRPPHQMAAQTVANYLIRAGVTLIDVREARGLLAGRLEQPSSADNPALQLFVECLQQLNERLSYTARDSEPPARSIGEDPHRTPVLWHQYDHECVSVASQVGLAIARVVAGANLSPGIRLGSEEELRERYDVSRACMRQAVRLLETSGIIESRPGRRLGVFASVPRPLPVIRRCHSHYLALQVSGKHCTEAIKAFGAAALGKLIGSLNREVSDSIAAELKTIRGRSRGARVAPSRLLLREIFERWQNPIIGVFWKSIAGYTFRAFADAEAASRAGSDTFPVNVRRICEAALARDAAGAAASFDRIFLVRPASSWTIQPQ